MIASLFGSSLCAAELGTITTETLADTSVDNFNEGIKITEDSTATGVRIENFKPHSGYDKHAVSVSQGATLTVNGDVIYQSNPQPSTDSNKDGTYAFTAGNTATNAIGHILLNGNVSIIVTDAEGTVSEYGANGVYSAGGNLTTQENSTITIGSNASNSATIFVVANKADAISAKLGGKVEFKSTHNQVIGSIDFITDFRGKDFVETLSRLKLCQQSSVTGVFSGKDSFWFGDDNSFSNVQSVDGFGSAGDLIKEYRDVFSSALNLTFTNGAQWTYLGNQNTVTNDNGSMTIHFDTKRISNITLENGGIINLYDVNIEDFCKEHGLLNNYITLTDKHDYVRVGNLNGSDGIFRFDANGGNKAESDMIFVENAQEGKGGIHHVQVEGLDTLDSITDTNTLVFAVVNQDAVNKGVGFNAIENVEGASLFDYDLYIRNEKFGTTTDGDVESITFDDLKNREELSGRFDNFIDEYKDGGEFWEIYRVVKSNSSATLGMLGAGYAGYDLAVNMDRRDRRIHEMASGDASSNGLWVRVGHGSMGASGVYRNDLNTMTLGFESSLSPTNRLGGWFSYSKGDVDYSSVNGSADLERYELAVYDTILLGNHYVDLVGRIGRVGNEFSVTSKSGTYRTSGDFDQDYAAVSAEYGYTLKDQTTGVFIEPQLQVQAAYLRSFDYSTQRNMKAEADSETSVIGRAGFRFGRSIQTSESAGELYVRADVLHQFTDGQSAHLTYDTSRVDSVWGNKDTWANFGAGAYWNWSDRFTFQFDIERTVGGDIDHTWQMSGRAQYLF